MSQLFLRRVAPPLAAAALLAGTAGCGKSADQVEARRATTRFFAAVTAHQDATACRELAPQASNGLQTSDSSCAEQIGQLKLTGGTVRSVRVWGDRAQVVLTGDTVFLARFHDGWKVTAAGCRRQATGPYDCDVEA
jgi:hypothetical protein